MLVLESLEKSDAKVTDDLLGKVTFALALVVFRYVFTSQELLSRETCNPFCLSSHMARAWR